ELTAAGVERVAEARFVRELTDRRFLAREEMPAGRRSRPSVAFEIELLFRGSQRRSLARIDADNDDIELIAGAELQVLQALDKPVEHERAEHRAFVVTEHEHDRLAPEVIAELRPRACLIAEGLIKRKLLTELLLEG